MSDPSRALDRAHETWQKHGRSPNRFSSALPASKHGNNLPLSPTVIHQEWSDVTVADHKAIKGLKSRNLCDHLSEAELIVTALAELSTRQIAETTEATGMDEKQGRRRRSGRAVKQMYH